MSEAGSTTVVTRNALIEALCTVYDPEIEVNIYDLGLIYRLEVDTETQYS
jgi:metal-sulfur cluster biosynthetic enzyme